MSSSNNDDVLLPSAPLQNSTQYSCIHGVTQRAGPLNEAVVRIANLTSLEQANALIEIGAVWARMETLTEQDILGLYDDDDAVGSSSRAMYADVSSSWQKDDVDLDEYIEQMQSLRFRRILTPSWIEAGTDLRIYPTPRRFPACQQVTRDRLLYQDTTFLVLDKPPMLPTQPDASNYYENCPGAVQDNLGPFFDIQGREIARPLLCHRVDACVGGCVVLSKDRNGQKVFHQLQRDRQLRKVYLALTTRPVPTGMHVHWVWAPQSDPRRGAAGGPPCQLLRHTPPASRRQAREFWKRCVLEVVRCEPVDNGYFESTIRLVTGRKHQVRAQLASLQCPVVGDTLYAPVAGLTLDKDQMDEDALDAALAQCRAPTQPIGLQAHAILFGGIRVRARAPWWRGNSTDNVLTKT